MLHVRKATESDHTIIMSIYRYAQDYMIQSGNPNQWGHFYPESELIVNDIKEGACMVICDESGIHGVFALFEGLEPTYQYIENGEWLNDEPYYVIHRIASSPKAHGVMREVLRFAFTMTDNIRIDTHRDNQTMRRLLARYGFIECGIIYLANGDERLAFQLINHHTL